MPGQFPGGKYLDDLNPEEFTEEQKQALIRLRDTDPYAFYNLFRDPDAAQRMVEGDDFKTTPAGELYSQIGALKMAGAPDNVREFWSKQLATYNRPELSDDMTLLPPKTKPVQAKLDQIDEFCQYINQTLNYTDTYTYDPDESDFADDSPFAAKWAAVMRVGRGAPDVVEHHFGTAKHYKDNTTAGAHMGCEIVEINLVDYPAEFDLEEIYDGFPHPSGASIELKEAGVCIKLEFYDIYE